MKQIIYIIKIMIIPIIIIGVLCYVAPMILKLIDLNNVVTLNTIITATLNSAYLVWIFRIAIIIICILILRNTNKDKLFFDGDIYGVKSYYIYWIANKIYGFKKINLKMKPFYIIFKLVLGGLFEINDKPNENTTSKKVKIERVYKNEENKDECKECNLIISYTYDLQYNQIPIEKRAMYTVIVDRLEKGTQDRGYSENFVVAIGEEINKIKDMNINLFLATPIEITYRIIDRYLKMGGVEKLNVTIFQYNTKEKQFEKRGKKVLGEII